MNIVRILFALLCCWSICQPLSAQATDLDSLKFYQNAYNLRIRALMQAELGETLQAIGQMSIQDTSVFDADSLQRVIDRGQRIIEEDQKVQYFDQKYKYFLEKIRGKARKEDE